MKLNNKCGRVIFEASSKLLGLTNNLTSTKAVLSEVEE